MTFKMKRYISHAFIHLILLSITMITVIPLLWMITTSLKTPDNVMRMPPQWIPDPITLDSYYEAFTVQPLTRSLINSLLIALANVFGTLLFSSMAAFAFAKLRFRGKNLVFMILLTSLTVPSQVTLIPMYVAYSRIGWVDTYLPLILPNVLLNAYGVFMIRQFMAGVPDAYMEAARIDGAGYARIFCVIYLPLCKQILITLGLYNFINSWNNFLTPLVMLNSTEKFTVSLLLSTYKVMYNINWSLLMAASTVSVLPTMILFFLAQKHFVEGITVAGVKG